MDEKTRPYEGEMVIYGLFDPRTGKLRYIGKARDAQKRLKQHLRDTMRRDTPVYRWLRKIAALGLSPLVTVLQRVKAEDWREAEMKLIARARQSGMPILNVADGGDEPYCSSEVRAENGRKNARAIHSNPARKRLWALKQQMSAALKQGYGSPELRARLRALAARDPKNFSLWVNL